LIRIPSINLDAPDWGIAKYRVRGVRFCEGSSNLGAITPAGGAAIELYSTNTTSRKPS
jgi:hypothetical protein